MPNTLCPRVGHFPPLNGSFWTPSNCDALTCFASGSGCPSGNWRDATAPIIAHADEPIILVNAGANKGYAVAEFVQRYSADADYTPRDWLHNLTAIKGNLMLSCGFCKSCNAPMPERHAARRIHAHAFELMAANAVLLKLMFERMHVPGTVHAVALSNYTGTAYRFDVYRTGEEDLSASSEPRPHTKPTECIKLDDWAAREGVSRIHHLILDAEGWDIRILRGAATLLSSKRVDIVEYEHAPSRLARTMTEEQAVEDLAASIEWLGGFGYKCYVQGKSKHAPLMSLTAKQARGCLRLKEVRQMNLACAHDQRVLGAMDGLRMAGDRDATVKHSLLEDITSAFI